MGTIDLPPPDTRGARTLESAIAARRSRRRFDRRPIGMADLGQILWSAQGVTGRGRLRAAPSAGGTLPLEVLAVAGEGGVTGLAAGVYAYRPDRHAIEMLGGGDRRGLLAAAALGQRFLAEAPVTVAIAADPGRTSGRYGQRARRYVDMEVGHAGQNVCLQAEALGLGTVPVGAFDDAALAEALGLPRGIEPLYILPVGWPLD